MYTHSLLPLGQLPVVFYKQVRPNEAGKTAQRTVVVSFDCGLAFANQPELPKSHDSKCKGHSHAQNPK